MGNEELKAKIAQLKKSKSDKEERIKLEKELWDLEHPLLSRLGKFALKQGKNYGKHIDEATR